MADLVTPMCVRVAATLGLADLADAWETADALASRTDTDASVLRVVLDQLVTVGLFESRDGRYRVTEAGRGLSTEVPPLGLDGWLGRAELAFVELAHTVRTGEAAYPVRYGQDFWADLAARPELRQGFDGWMNRRFATHAPQIARRFDWSRFSRVVDVGGGDGTLLTEILLANPGLHGHVVDLPATADAATRRFAEAGLGDRATATAGSFFDPLPAGADAYVLSDILHNWGDEGARAILAGCAEAAGPDGVVLVIEIMRSPPGPHTAFELSMAVFFGGRERTPAEVAALVPGLTLAATTKVADNRQLLEFHL